MATDWDDFRDVLTGKADEKTRARVAVALQDPQSQISQLAAGCRDVSRPLFGALPVVVPIDPFRFYCKHIIFWLGSLLWLAHWFIAFPLDSKLSLPPRVFLLILMSGCATFAWMGGRIQLPSAGRWTRGTLVEGLTGMILGIGVSWIVMLLSPLAVTSLSQVSDVLWLFPFLLSLVGVSVGAGLRERLAATEQPARILWSIAIRLFVITWPWLAIPAFLFGVATSWIFSVVHYDDAGLPWPVIAVTLATVASALIPAQTCMIATEMKGSLLNGFLVVLLTLPAIVVLLLAVQITVQWATGFTGLGPVAVLAFLYFIYCTFAMGAIYKIESWRALLKRYVLAGWVGAIVAGCCSVAIGAGLYRALVGWIGEWSRLVVLLVLYYVFVEVFGRVHIFMDRRFGLCPDETATAIERRGAGSLSAAMSFAMFGGCLIVVRFFRTISEGLRSSKSWPVTT